MKSDNNLVPSFFTISQAGGKRYVTLGFFDVMGGAILKPKISKWVSNAKGVFSLCPVPKGSKKIHCREIL
jgi:hypothetical protein